MPTADFIAKCIRQARGLEAADLVLKNARIFNLTDGSFTQGDIAICGDRIVGVGESYEGRAVIDCSGLTAVPGFMDAHVHVESSLITPYEFERCVLPHGTVTAICDPHEISNVCGLAAIEYFLDCAANMRMDLLVALSSCVPATDMETAGASITCEDLRRFADKPCVAGLAELMNVPGVLNLDTSVLAKIEQFYGNIDGHSPLLGGKDLNAYLAAGVGNDHECSQLDEAREKLRKGMAIFIREGSVARNLDELMPLVTIENAPFLAFCTDDRNPKDIAENGHIDGMVARCLAAGCNPLAVYRTACLSPAQQRNLKYKGLVAPGYLADIVLLSDFGKCQVSSVICKGRLVNEELFASRKPEPSTELFRNSVKCSKVKAEDFRIVTDKTEMPVIGIRELSLLTDYLKMDMPAGEKKADVSRDIAKIAVLERHGKNGNKALGFVHGFKMQKGAIASTVGHDSHNICVVGMNDEDMACAVNALIDAQGGFAVAIDGEVIGLGPLPLGGLMSDKNCKAVHDYCGQLQNAAKETGCPLEAPFLQLAFLPLPVIPFLRITDKGVFDVAKWSFV